MPVRNRPRQSEITDLHLRIPNHLAEQLREAAEKNRRSLNNEMWVRLSESFLPKYRVTP